jgi:lysophospholipase L1-like esterase
MVHPRTRPASRVPASLALVVALLACGTAACAGTTPAYVLGDSIFDNRNVPAGQPQVVDLLAAAYPQFAFTNLAKRGTESGYELATEVPEMAHGCGLVVLDAGANDAQHDVDRFLTDVVSKTDANLAQIVRAIRSACPDAEIVVATYVNDYRPGDPRYANFARINDDLRKLAAGPDAAGHVVIADLANDARFTPFPGSPYMWNTVHENAAGQPLMAEDIEKALAAAPHGITPGTSARP